MNRCQHESTKDWWYEVADIRITKFMDRATALEAEQASIKSEHPVFNEVHKCNV